MMTTFSVWSSASLKDVAEATVWFMQGSCCLFFLPKGLSLYEPL